MKFDLRNNRNDLLFNIFLFFFAIQPLFGHTGISDYITWGLTSIFLILFLISIGMSIKKNKLKNLCTPSSKNLFTYLNVVWCILALVIGYCFDPHVLPFWILVTALYLIYMLLPDRSKKKEI